MNSSNIRSVFYAIYTVLWLTIKGRFIPVGFAIVQTKWNLLSTHFAIIIVAMRVCMCAVNFDIPRSHKRTRTTPNPIQIVFFAVWQPHTLSTVYVHPSVRLVFDSKSIYLHGRFFLFSFAVVCLFLRVCECVHVNLVHDLFFSPVLCVNDSFKRNFSSAHWGERILVSDIMMHRFVLSPLFASFSWAILTGATR